MVMQNELMGRKAALGVMMQRRGLAAVQREMDVAPVALLSESHFVAALQSCVSAAALRGELVWTWRSQHRCVRKGYIRVWYGVASEGVEAMMQVYWYGAVVPQVWRGEVYDCVWRAEHICVVDRVAGQAGHYDRGVFGGARVLGRR